MTTTIYKPVTRKGPVFLAPTDQGPPTITTEDGQVITAVRADRAGGVFFNEGRFQYVFPQEVIGLKNFTLTYGGDSSVIEDGGQSFEGSGVGNWQPRDKGSVGSGFTGTGVPGGFGPGNFGNLGFFPADLTGLFPSPVLSEYDPIDTAPYDFTDVREFAEQFGQFNREELQRNNELAKTFAFDALDTELKGLERFSPGAGALKRRELSLDNQFNQMQREQQISQALPFARGDLEAQRGRANIFARGGVPDEITDRGLEIGIRSGQADRASSAGFGASSSVSRKAQDLMTARERIQLSQYGDQALSSNINQQANLFLAPTQYSDAGAQIRTMPSLSGSQLQTAARGEIGQSTLVSPGQALSTQVQQNQFTTGLEQQTRQFNAGNILQNNQFNAGTQNEFALSKFGYQVGLAGAIAGAAQTASNTQIQLEQQQAALDLYRETLEAGQRAAEVNSIFKGILGLVGAAGGITGLLDSITSLFDGGADTDSVDSDGGGILDDEGNTVEQQPGAPGGSPEGVEPSPEFQPGAPGGSPPGVEDAEPFSARAAITEAPETAERFIARASSSAPTKAMQAAGISNSPGPDKISAGFDGAGKQVFLNAKLASNSDRTEGSKTVQGLIDVLTPFGVLTDDDKSTLAKVKGVTDDVNFIASLADQYNRGDKKGFINTVLNRFQKPVIDELVSDKSDRAGLNAAVDAAQLFLNWDRMSPAAKSKAIASIALNTADFAGKPLRQVPIIKPGAAGAGTPGLNVGQAVSLLNAGFNVYNLVDNWDQYNDLQKIAGGAGTLSSIALTAKELGVLNGVGGQAGTFLGTSGILTGVGGVAGIALGADQLRRSWGKGGKEGAVQGFVAGAAMASGLIAMTGGAGAPIAAGLMATSVLGSVIKTGKEENQVARDRIRSHFKKVGLVDNDYKIALPDGSFADLGVDGKGGRHKALDSSKLKAGRELYSYDIDYTNDLDFISGMGGIALSRMISGGAGKNVDQMGGQLGNQALGKVGFGKELTKANFDQVMQNQRGIYAQAGVKSKADAYALTDQLLKEGRINATEAVSMQQAANMMYDSNGFDTAKKLMNGRWSGVNLADEKNSPKPNVRPGDSIDPGFSRPAPRPEVYVPENQGPSIDPGFSRPFPDATRRPSAPDFKRELDKAKPYKGMKQMRKPTLSKEEILQRNKERYAA